MRLSETYNDPACVLCRMVEGYSSLDVVVWPLDPQKWPTNNPNFDPIGPEYVREWTTGTWYVYAKSKTPSIRSGHKVITVCRHHWYRLHESWENLAKEEADLEDAINRYEGRRYGGREVLYD